MDKVIKIGTVAGRHEMPVDGYILDKVEFPSDIEGIRKDVNHALMETVGEYVKSGWGIAVNGFDDGCIFHAPGVKVELYVTGLTQVTVAALSFLVKNGFSVDVMNYDRETGEYVPQFFC